jgi:general secretion pathway protein A
MYETFYGFTGAPFQLPPDARFFYGSRGHKRAMSHLLFGLQQGEGFVVITGDVGAGKTTLVEQLWSSLNRETYVLARIVTTQLSGNDLFRLAMAGFGVDISDGDKAGTILRFQDVLRERHVAGQRCVLIVDEAQNLSRSALEELRMLSNFSSDGHVSVQTILLGQPEFRGMLASRELDQLRQRVIASFHLAPLGRSETRAYIEHRLSTVGWSGRPDIEVETYDAVYSATGGVPRRINRLFSRVLLLGALDEATTITPLMVEQTSEELASDLDGPSEPGSHSLMATENNDGDLAARVTALERIVERRENVMRRLSDLLGPRG